jgi:hypothetical protein
MWLRERPPRGAAAHQHTRGRRVAADRRREGLLVTGQNFGRRGTGGEPFFETIGGMLRLSPLAQRGRATARHDSRAALRSGAQFGGRLLLLSEKPNAKISVE